MLTKLFDWIGRFFAPLRKVRGFVVAEHDDLPETIGAQTLYAIGKRDHLWQVAFMCPCGCESTIQLPLTQEARPRWTLTIDSGSPTLRPSVRPTVGCRSHFSIRKGLVLWATD